MVHPPGVVCVPHFEEAQQVTSPHHRLQGHDVAPDPVGMRLLNGAISLPLEAPQAVADSEYNQTRASKSEHLEEAPPEERRAIFHQLLGVVGRVRAGPAQHAVLVRAAECHHHGLEEAAGEHQGHDDAGAGLLRLLPPGLLRLRQPVQVPAQHADKDDPQGDRQQGHVLVCSEGACIVNDVVDDHAHTTEQRAHGAMCYQGVHGDQGVAAGAQTREELVQPAPQRLVLKSIANLEDVAVVVA
mmetsp:Transcript_23229/g.66650  ORF Transcript_23229/g.66650 Transcript_23229/m.66650 type:complete len:242 (-) Transcript_23229:897-1622(-)